MSCNITVSDALLGTAGISVRSDTVPSNVYEAIRQYRNATLFAGSEPEYFAKCSLYMDELDGWKVLARIDEVATLLKVKSLENQPLSTLSGGERKRVALAAAFVVIPDVLLLDEPTNHLDLAAIKLLSNIISTEKKMTVLCVTHDRKFLDDVCNTVIELDEGRIYSYSGSIDGEQGGYSAYLEGKEARLANEDSALRAASAKYRTELEWMRRQPKARESKSKARVQAFYDLKTATKPGAIEANLELNTNDGQRRIGKNVLALKNASLKFGENKVILDSFTYNFNRGDKLAIVGSNGVGKSSFIKILTGLQPIDSGSIEIGETVVFGTYDQMGLHIEQEDQRVMDYMKETVEASGKRSMAEAPQEAMRLLQRFQFQRQRWNDPIALLSGGERRRLQLLTVLAKQPNFLILDEPTNDIDLDTLSALESYLAEYNGVLVVVSHDRFFTDKVTNHLFIFEGNGIVKDFVGTLSDYAEILEDQESTNAVQGGPSASQAKKKVSYHEDKEKRVKHRNVVKKIKREMNNLETKIDKLKAMASEIQIETDNTDRSEGWTVLAELTDKMNKLNDEADDKEMLWLELAEELEKMEAAEYNAT